MSLSFYGKRPGPGMRLDKLSLQFAMHDTGLAGDVLEAYERLILDAMKGDHTLFTTAEGIERLWEVSTPLLKAPPPVRLYAPGSWGPNAIHQLVAPQRLATALRARVAGSQSPWVAEKQHGTARDIARRRLGSGIQKRPVKRQMPRVWAGMRALGAAWRTSTAFPSSYCESEDRPQLICANTKAFGTIIHG